MSNDLFLVSVFYRIRLLFYWSEDGSPSPALTLVLCPNTACPPHHSEPYLAQGRLVDISGPAQLCCPAYCPGLQQAPRAHRKPQDGQTISLWAKSFPGRILFFIKKHFCVAQYQCLQDSESLLGLEPQLCCVFVEHHM